MRSTKTIFVIAALLAMGGAATLAAHAERRMVPVSTTIKELLDDLDAASRRELATGCTEDDGHGGKRLCGDSKKKIDAMTHDATMRVDSIVARPPERRAHAVSRIRAFRKEPALAIDYRATTANPYADDDAAKVETYVDDHGFEYWIDPADDAIVQAGPGAGMHPPAPKAGSARLAVAELRTRAEAVAASEVQDFPSRKASLHPLEDNKDRQIYFFRWDDFSQPTKDSQMPPFLQVGLWADGGLASFTNTLTR